MLGIGRLGVVLLLLAGPSVDWNEQLSLTRWGMSEAAVKALFPDGVAMSGDWVCPRRFMGKPALLALHLLDGRLRAYSLISPLLPTPEAAYAEFQVEKQKLVDTFGAQTGRFDSWNAAIPKDRGALYMWLFPKNSVELSVYASDPKVRLMYSDPKLDVMEKALLGARRPHQLREDPSTIEL